MIRADQEKLLALARRILEFAFHGDYSNGNEAFGCDEGRVLAREGLEELERQLKELEEVARLT